MAQSSPNWSLIILGSGGLLGAVTYITKGLVDQKEDHIQQLTKHIQRLELEVKAEKEKSQRLLDDLTERVRNMDAQRLSPEDAIRLRDILRVIGSFENLQEGFADCKRAAEWVEICKKGWVQQAWEHANRKYRDLLSKDKAKLFKEDISHYLDWVYTCLYKHGHTLNTPLSDFVKNPAIQSHHPYVAAIENLLNEGTWGELTSKQKAYLQEVLTQLIEKIRDEF